MSGGVIRGQVRQPDYADVLREHKRRISILEALLSTQSYPFYQWLPLVGLTITEYTHPAGDPTVDSFGGSWFAIPGPGNDPQMTTMTHLIFSATLGAMGASPTGKAWEFHFDLGIGANIVELYGSGRLLHTEPDGSAVTYHLEFSADSDAIFATVAGVDPAPTDVGSGQTVGFLRSNYPCVIVDGDQFQGWMFGLTQQAAE